MAPVYQLKFFDFMGVAEPIRYLFAYGGISYKNIVINKDADWPDVQKCKLEIYFTSGPSRLRTGGIFLLSSVFKPSLHNYEPSDIFFYQIGPAVLEF